jgi:antitoxin CptB
MKELDVMLGRWLEECYPTASAGERAAFAEFLELPDPELVQYLLGGVQPDHAAFASIVAQLTAIRR